MGAAKYQGYTINCQLLNFSAKNSVHQELLNYFLAKHSLNKEA